MSRYLWNEEKDPYSLNLMMGVIFMVGEKGIQLYFFHGGRFFKTGDKGIQFCFFMLEDS